MKISINQRLFLLRTLFFSFITMLIIGPIAANAENISTDRSRGVIISRIYTGEDGESHFEDLEIAQSDTAKWSRKTPLDVKKVWFQNDSGELRRPWHTAPCRLLVVVLKGGFELECWDGTKRKFQAGDAFLVEDTTGRGHTTRALKNGAESIWVSID